jgi:hypothetical protein
MTMKRMQKICLIIVFALVCVLLGFGYVIGLYYAKDFSNPGGPHYQEIPIMIKMCTLPSVYIKWLYRFHGWQAQQIHPNGKEGYDGIILMAHYSDQMYFHSQ